MAINIPKNNDLRSKAFLCHAKEQMLKLLFDALNKENEVDLKFKRSSFIHYKGFVGRGNNAPLIMQLFKGSRWWWNLYMEANERDETGRPVLKEGQNAALMREDFKEHNFIFT